jgi:hypothetical protein
LKSTTQLRLNNCTSAAIITTNYVGVGGRKSDRVRYRAEHMRGVRLHVDPDESAAGHCVALSRPKQLASIMRGYVEKPRDGH